MEKLCYVCDVYGGLEDQPGVRICACRGALRFVAWGTCPTTGRQADKLFPELRKKIVPPKKRGPKSKTPDITFLDVIREIEKLPASAGIQRVASNLGVDRGKVQRAIKPLVKWMRELDPACVGFNELRAVIKGKWKSRLRKLLPD